MEIKRRLQQTYRAVGALPDTTITAPLAIQAKEWWYFARDYSRAAQVIYEKSPYLWLPRLMLTGHSIELALKACLLELGIQPPREHSLVNLYCLLSDREFELSELEQACIVHLEHFYNMDLATETKYKSRYPATRSEHLGGAVPDHPVFENIIESLFGQAEKIRAATPLLSGMDE